MFARPGIRSCGFAALRRRVGVVSDPSVVVVGGGIVGLACAWELRRAGADVTVLERGRVGGGASRGNAGWVVPSMARPLAGPGAVREGLHQLATRGQAFVLRPSLDPSFVRWLWRFRKSCTAERFDASVRALMVLNRRTLELFDEYRAAGIPFEMHESGLVIAARSVEGLEHLREVFRRLRELGYEGGEPDELDGSALAELEPALDPTAVAAGLHARVDRHVRPEELTAGLAAKLRVEGVRVEEQTEVRSLERGPAGWRLGVEGGELAADRVVVAAALETERLVRHLGLRVPMQPARGYSVTIRGSGTPPRHALYLTEARIGLSPFAEGVRVAGTFELGASSAEAPAGAGEKLLAAARPYLSGWRPDTDGPLSTWAGLRPATADGLPLIGALPGQDGLFVAAGHGMLGVTLAPATAALLAPLVLHGRAAPELAPFSPGRS
jgi:D-amino-acid dehydrogenase